MNVTKNEDTNEVNNKSLSSFLSSIRDFNPYFKNEKLSAENVSKNKAK
jgi:site-specific recombinase XerD